MYQTPNWEIPDEVRVAIIGHLEENVEFFLEAPWALGDLLTIDGITSEVLTDDSNVDFLSLLKFLLEEMELEGCKSYLEVWLKMYHEQGRDCLFEVMAYSLHMGVEAFLSESV